MSRGKRRHPSGASDITTLYEQTLRAKRTGPLYCAFPYPTKISPDAIALFISSHTKVGDTVFDGFAGSGTTGLAALLCENPSDDLRMEAERLGLSVNWGPRNAIMYEIGALGAFVGRTLTNPPDPKAFQNAANHLLREVEQDTNWMYTAIDPDGGKGEIRHAIWSDILRCPACQHEATLWECCVSLHPARIAPTFSCPYCGHKANMDQIEHIVEQDVDDITLQETEHRSRKLVRIYGITGKQRWSRPAISNDLELLENIATESLPHSVPNVAIPWGDLYRAGYHHGITHVHHFYTRRNLIVFGRLWNLTEQYEKSMTDALRFWLLSYNASHATIMTRVVAKSQQKELVVTSAQPGVLYVSGLPVEKNLFAGLQRKIKTVTEAFKAVHGRSSKIEVHQKSCCAVDLPDNSIDYVFTDPPFGGNIPYAEINFLNEAWLGSHTDRTDEIIISNNQHKNILHYQELLMQALSEVYRILKPTGCATLVFHSASAKVWNALQAAYTGANFNVETAGILDKTQGSFKQVTAMGATRDDPILLLSKKYVSGKQAPSCAWTVAEQLMKAAMSLDSSEQTPQRLYSRLIGHFLGIHQKIPIDANAFYKWHSEYKFVK